MRITDIDEEGQALRRSIVEMLDRVVRPVIDARDESPYPKDVMQLFYSNIAETTGFFGTRVPVSDGGTGLPRVLAGMFLECVPAFLGVSCCSHEATAYRISLSGSGELKERYLPSLVQGSLIGGTAVSEPDTGSDSNHPKTRFIVKGDTVEVNGTKLWTTNGTIADVMVVVGREDNSGKVSRVLVDTSETEVIASEVPMMGLKRGHLCEVQIVGSVPAKNILDDTSGGSSSVLARSWTMNRVSMALLALSVARRAVEYAIEYAKEREQFGKKIGSFQLVQALIADASVSVEAGRLLCYRALSSLDDGVESTLTTSMAKLFGTEAAIQAVMKAQQVVGTFGVSAESPFDEWYRDVRMFSYPDGTPQIQQLLIGRELTGLSAF